MASSVFRTTAATTTTTSSTATVRLRAFRSPALSFRFRPQAHPPSLRLSCSSAVPRLNHLRRARQRPEYIPNQIPDPNYVRVFDTTLRDGEQSPGAALTSKQKLIIARELAKLRVDVIEAGFPAASKDDFEAVKAIAKTVGNEVDEETGYMPAICGLSRCNKEDVTAAWEAVKYAKRPRIHVFISTSDIHMKHKLRKTRDEVVRMATTMVRFARNLGCPDVEFGAEDAARSDKEFLYEILGEVIREGAATVNIADTVGIHMPTEFGQLIADIKANTPGIHNVIISTHCQNDLGLSTANTIFGACAGARQVEVTVNGIGERGGNASLEEVVMALKCRGEAVMGGLYTGIDTTRIIPASKLVEEHTGLHVQPHKAIVGANAFAHESGIHQDGMLKHKNTYEIMLPEDVGLERDHELGIVLGKLSGRHALKDRLRELGYEIEKDQLNNVFRRFKALAEHKKRVTDADLIALMSDDKISRPEGVWKLLEVQVLCGTQSQSRATVKLMDPLGKEHIACSVGTGPVDSAYKAIDLIIKKPVTLTEYTMNNIAEGIDGIATTHVSIQKDYNLPSADEIPHTYSGIGAGTDIIVSSVKAYIGALNKMLATKHPLSEKICNGAFQAGKDDP